MATDETIDSEDFILFDNWPGVPQQCNGQPVAYNLQGSDSHNVATAAHPVGTKFQVYNDGSVAGLNGYSTLIYLQVGTQGATTAIAAKTICAGDDAADPYEVTNSGTDAIDLGAGLCAVAIGTTTDAYYGWFWCGGVCPEVLCDSLADGASQTMGGNYYGKFNLELGPMYMATASATVHAAKNAIRFASYSATTVLAGAVVPVGAAFVVGS